tara:strand:+ start:26557 stop:26736 length:180 start_codon:yes stop_codon:yes gene_type:complete
MFGSKEHYAAWFGTGGLLLISISAWGFIFDGDYFGATVAGVLGVLSLGLCALISRRNPD